MRLLRLSLLPHSPALALTLTLTLTPHHHPSLPTPFPLRSSPPLLLHHHHHSPWRRPRLSSPSPIPSASASDHARPAAAAGFEEELRRLLVLLPSEMRRRVEDHAEFLDLVEIVMDLGRRPLARFPSGDFFLSDRPISDLDLRHAASQVGDFAADNRAGISRTLHRISAIRNRKGVIIGLTCRVGRTVTGSANLLRDLVKDGGSLLLIGPPGVGKTTIIREIARMLADDYKKRVMIVDTSNEIGGDGDIPHAGIGSARRLQVPNADMQHKVLIEAVENHMPQVIVIDEIGTKLEAMAASTIAQRGIQLVATAHGVTIENLVMNPSLEMLVGGIQSVTLGDEEASRRGVQKTVLERKGPSTFTCCAEIISKTELRVHRNFEDTVDALLAGRSLDYEVRKSDKDKKGSMHEFLHVQQESFNDTITNEDGIGALDYSGWDDTSTLDSAVTLDLAEKQIERSHKSEAGFALYVYGADAKEKLASCCGTSESSRECMIAMENKIYIEVIRKEYGGRVGGLGMIPSESCVCYHSESTEEVQKLREEVQENKRMVSQLQSQLAVVMEFIRQKMPDCNLGGSSHDPESSGVRYMSASSNRSIDS